MRPAAKRPVSGTSLSCALTLTALLAGVSAVAAEQPKDKPTLGSADGTHPSAGHAQAPVTNTSQQPPHAAAMNAAPKNPAPANAAAPPASADSPPALRIAIPPGPQKDTLRRVLLKPYAAVTGTELGDVAWDGSPDAIAKLAADHAADLILVDGNALAAGCAAQTFRRLDWNRLGRARFLPGASSDCGVGAFMTATVLAWDREKLQGDQKPQAAQGSADSASSNRGDADHDGKAASAQSGKDTAADAKPAPDGSAKPAAPNPQWSDFWDVAKHPGRRGLQRRAQGNLEFALLADGVAAGDIYRTLRTGDGVDRAFRKLDQLKPYIMWWDQPGEPAQFLSSGKVLFTSAPASSLSAMNPPAGHARPGVQWTGSLNAVQSWAAVQVPNQGAAHEDATIAAMLIATDPAREAELARATGYGPSTSDALALLPDDLRNASPAAAANLKQGLALDEGFWRDNGKALEARFSDWVSK